MLGKEEKEERSNKMDLAFSGAGFLGCYYFGVVDCWQKYIPRDRVNRVAGTSAGSLTAAYYLLNLPLDKCLEKVIVMTEDVRRRTLGVFDRSNQIVDVMPVALDEIFPDDAHKKVGNRLYVCMTRLKDMKKVVVNEFESKKDLIDALNCSCFIPVWSGNHVPTYKGEKHIDGGFTDCLPAFDERTIRVCCFSGDTDISPYDKIKPKILSRSVANMPMNFNFANLRRGKTALTPLPAKKIIRLLEQGFHDTKNFILTNDLIQCDDCFNNTDPSDQPVYSRPSPCITPRDMSPLNSRKFKPSRSGQYLAPGNEKFNNLLRGKLERHSSDLILESTLEDRNTPQIKISLAEDSNQRKASVQSLQNAKISGGAKGKENRRRGTCAKLPTMLGDKYTAPVDPLPSCPPSPNLNRHCPECIRLRQEARNDFVEESVRAEVEKFVVHEKPSKIRDTLVHPIRWLKQIGVKNSYDIAKYVT